MPSNVIINVELESDFYGRLSFVSLAYSRAKLSVMKVCLEGPLCSASLSHWGQFKEMNTGPQDKAKVRLTTYCSLVLGNFLLLTYTAS